MALPVAESKGPFGLPVMVVEENGLPVTIVGGGGLLPTQAIVDDGTTITLSPASGTSPAQGVANVAVVDNVATYRLAANRVALQSGATAPVQNSAGAAIGTGTITVAANDVSHVRLPATVAGVANSGSVSVRNSAGADSHPATAVVASGALTGVNLAATVAMIDNGDTITATSGQTINVAVADGVASMTVAVPFWNPFTVTVGENDGLFGYYNGELGSITNEPVDEFTVVSIWHNGAEEGQVNIQIRGPEPLANDGLFNGLFGIDGATYSAFGVSSGKESGADWITYIYIDGPPPWTVDQQIPIVIIPQP